MKIDEAYPAVHVTDYRGIRWRTSVLIWIITVMRLQKLIEELSALPGIGAKSAQRLAFHILNMPQDHVDALASAIVSAKKNVKYCKCCYNLTDQEICPICSDTSRDHKTIMVVKIPAIWLPMKKSRKIQRGLPCVAWCNFPHAWNRSERYPAEGTDGASGKRCG